MKRMLRGVAAFLLMLGFLAGQWNVAPVQAAFPGDNGRLLVKDVNVTYPTLYTINEDGSDKQQVTNLYGDLGVTSNPRWSPDGKRFAYTYDGQIIIALADGTPEHFIEGWFTSNGRFADIAWSPDGLRLLVTDNSNDHLYVVNIDGSNPQLMYGAPVSSPAWSPDGKYVAFSHGGDILIGNNETGEVLNWTGFLDRSDDNPVWSPDGKGLAFESLSGNDWQVYILDFEADMYYVMTAGPNYHMYPAWSPDGYKLAYYSMDPLGNNRKYILMDLLTGTTTDILTVNTGTVGIDWQPIASSPIYRMANWRTHERLFTTNPYEVFSAMYGDDGWVYENIAFGLADSADPNAVPVYRLANWITKERLFTTSQEEANYAVANYPGWILEGVAFHAYSTAQPDTQAVYRLANWKTHERLFTTDLNEANHAVANLEGWVLEGTAFYAPTK